MGREVAKVGNPGNRWDERFGEGFDSIDLGTIHGLSGEYVFNIQGNALPSGAIMAMTAVDQHHDLIVDISAGQPCVITGSVSCPVTLTVAPTVSGPQETELTWFFDGLPLAKTMVRWSSAPGYIYADIVDGQAPDQSAVYVPGAEASGVAPIHSTASSPTSRPQVWGHRGQQPLGRDRK